ncbi:MAG: hypothetical protein HPY90_14770 [Syntrophothermus sp.]|uniref:hypothetical protein n=1 Tax=Syntrophothermus sp. TaxID=2736299 RepID=UPI0025799322|nr:hypothetical protein [Syntrophothermus sp.]NSW84483.1 hypothetical protein [Syntrophothermus sp.]
MSLEQLTDSAREIIMTLAANNASFIPASPTDEPPLETEPADPDKIKDDSYFGDDNICETYEPVDRFRPILNIPVGSPIRRSEDHVFRYFLDGSLRTYYWGDVAISTASYPVLVSETAVSILKRNEEGRLYPCRSDHQLLAIFPFTSGVLRDALENRPLGMITPVFLESEPDPRRDLRTILAAKARERLHALEANAAANLAGRADGEWLIIDGDIRQNIFLRLKNVIGLAKSFSWKPVIKVANSQFHFNLPRVIQRLRENERTPVLRKKSGDYPSLAFWYLRFWPIDRVDNYMQGVVKVEAVMEGQWDEEKAALVSRLSRALIAEKAPVIYPERRWHSHIYPIYQAETHVKETLFSPQVMRQILFARGGFNLSAQ